jgi:hypothetical protein
LMLQQVRWAEVEAAKPQKIMISWQPAVWFIEILAGRPFTIHLTYSDMEVHCTVRLLVLLPSCTTAAHEGRTVEESTGRLTRVQTFWWRLPARSIRLIPWWGRRRGGGGR